MHQQHVGGHLAIRSLTVLVLCAALFSFAERPGGDTFSIYLNEKLLLQQHVWLEQGVKNISLAGTKATEVLSIQYSHCGKVGTARSLAVLNDANKMVKTWRFADSDPVRMEVPVGEILTLQKTSGRPLHLVYASTEMPNGKTLVNIEAPDAPRASLR